MDLRTGILESANALGMDPSWLATIISYETGGTFNPTQAGPTTQFGQHRGLIQFGEPQAQQYGVDWNNPLASQLGKDGAVVRYFRDRGWQPGMDFVNAYATVNAGSPTRVNASDANNGGAPGTVADKVNTQMAGHWQNAARLLGGDFTPPQSSGAAMTPTLSTQSPGLLGQQQPQKRGLLGMDSEKINRLGLALMAASGYAPFQPLIQAQMADLRDARKEREDAKRVNQTVEFLRRMNPEVAAAVEAGVLSPSDAYKVATGGDAQGRVVSAEQLQEMFPGADIAPGLYNLKADGTVTKVGGAATVVNVNNGEDKFAESFGKADGELLSTVYSNGLSAMRNVGRIDQLDQLLRSAPSGAEGRFKQMAGEFGIATDGLNEIQAATAIINSLVPEQRQPGSGPMSDADLALFKQSLPRIINQPGGNELIVNTMRAIAEYDARGAQIVQELRAGRIDRATAFQMLQERENPLSGFKAPSGGAEDQGSDLPTFNPETGMWE